MVITSSLGVVWISSVAATEVSSFSGTLVVSPALSVVTFPSSVAATEVSSFSGALVVSSTLPVVVFSSSGVGSWDPVVVS